jgi:hypothetical protein
LYLVHKWSLLHLCKIRHLDGLVYSLFSFCRFRVQITVQAKANPFCFCFFCSQIRRPCWASAQIHPEQSVAGVR